MRRSTRTAKAATTPVAVPSLRGPSSSPSAAHLLSLPEELLGDILGRLPLVELIRARQVCQRFRATVARLEAEDARHYFTCGASDAHSIHQLPHTVPLARCAWANDSSGTPCTCGAILWTSDDITKLMRGDGEGGGGGDEDEEEEAQAQAEGRRERYADRHESPHPPVQWAHLAPARALALEIAQQCARVDTRTVNPHGFMVDHNDQEVMPVCGWVPTVVYLPDDVIRPARPADMVRLAAGLFSQFYTDYYSVARLLARLASPKEANAFYRGNAGPRMFKDEPVYFPADGTFPDDWRKAWKTGRRYDDHDDRDVRDEETDDDDDADEYEESLYEELIDAIPSLGGSFHEAANARDSGGWADWEFRVRRLAASWRLAVAQRDTRRFRRFCLGGTSNTPPFNIMDNAQVTAYLDNMVATVDATRAFLHSRCDLPVVFTDDSDIAGPRVWVGGMSPDGLLVGAMTAVKDFW